MFVDESFLSYGLHLYLCNSDIAIETITAVDTSSLQHQYEKLKDDYESVKRENWE